MNINNNLQKIQFIYEQYSTKPIHVKKISFVPESNENLMATFGAVFSSLDIKTRIDIIIKEIKNHEICKQFADLSINIKIFKFTKNWTYIVYPPNTSELIKKFSYNKKEISLQDIKRIIEIKQEYLNTKDYTSHFKMIENCCNLLKIKIIDKTYE